MREPLAPLLPRPVFALELFGRGGGIGHDGLSCGGALEVEGDGGRSMGKVD
jgi:hypothetical protein